MSKLKQYWAIILLVVAILGGIFYWYELRPSNAAKNCILSLKDKYGDTNMSIEKADSLFKFCLRTKGIDK